MERSTKKNDTTPSEPDSGAFPAATPVEAPATKYIADGICDVRSMLQDACANCSNALIALVAEEEGYDPAAEVTRALQAITVAQDNLFGLEIKAGGEDHKRNAYSPKATASPPVFDRLLDGTRFTKTRDFVPPKSRKKQHKAA